MPHNKAQVYRDIKTPSIPQGKTQGKIIRYVKQKKKKYMTHNIRKSNSETRDEKQTRILNYHCISCSWN